MHFYIHVPWSGRRRPRLSVLGVSHGGDAATPARLYRRLSRTKRVTLGALLFIAEAVVSALPLTASAKHVRLQQSM